MPKTITVTWSRDYVERIATKLRAKADKGHLAEADAVIVDIDDLAALSSFALDALRTLGSAETPDETTIPSETVAPTADPTPEMLVSQEFEAVWRAIKGWDIQRSPGEGYAGATGTDVRTILDALAAPHAEDR